MDHRAVAARFRDQFDLPGDWRILLDRIEATFVAPSFAAGAAFVGAIAEAADGADHHPDVDLRYPGVVHVALTTHAVGSLTELDAALAGRLSALAAVQGLRSEPHAALRVEVAIDATDIDAVRPFWAALLGHRPVRTGTVGDELHLLVDPRRIGPPVWFQQRDPAEGDDARRNRLHLDVEVPEDLAEERVAAALAAGGRLVSDGRAPAWWVLADPEGNEACVCTWQQPA